MGPGLQPRTRRTREDSCSTRGSTALMVRDGEIKILYIKYIYHIYIIYYICELLELLLHLFAAGLRRFYYSSGYIVFPVIFYFRLSEYRGTEASTEGGGLLVAVWTGRGPGSAFQELLILEIPVPRLSK